jgi:hypothetical protein
MNQFLVNGVSTELPNAVRPESDLGELIQHIETTYVSDSALLSSVLIDGVEMTCYDQNELATLPLTGIRSVEVVTTTPKELAEETLQDLLPFCEGLADMSRRVAADLGSHEREFRQLVDGIEMLIESVMTVRMTLRVAAIPPVNVLEAEIVSILRDLVDSKQAGNQAHLSELLSEHLPKHLEDWRREGIPALIRCRDS